MRKQKMSRPETVARKDEPAGASSRNPQPSRIVLLCAVSKLIRSLPNTGRIVIRNWMRSLILLPHRVRGGLMGALSPGIALGVAFFCLMGCRASYYRNAADKEVYKILQAKQTNVFGETNAFSIDTPFSHRKPEEIPAQEIIEDRLKGGKSLVTLTDALRIAIENNRQYQLRKETLYLSALTLTRERYNFRPQLFASTVATGTRQPNGDRSGSLGTRAGVDQLLKSGGSLGLTLANDLLRFYTGDPRKSAVSTLSVNLVQPLLRGAGAKIAAENLTQAERNVIYEVRSFSHYQNTFALDVVSTYLRLLQTQDRVRNEYNNYISLVDIRKRTEDLAVDRLPQFQADQARQEELRARSRYIAAVEAYQNSLDTFKITLGLPVGHDIQLDDQALKEVEKIGLLPIDLEETVGFQLALDHRLDLLNEIDVFEDSKRKIVVAANRLKPELNLFADASLQSERPTDYAKFDLNDYRASAGVQLNLPLDRLLERNAYRSALISFERQLRTLALFLDNVRNDIREGLRALEQASQDYEIQKNARQLADRRVENFEILLQAGRAEARDVLDAQNARLQTYNALTQALVDYHLTRLRLLLDMGLLDSEIDQFWLKENRVVQDRSPTAPTTPAPNQDQDLISPDKLFEKQP